MYSSMNAPILLRQNLVCIILTTMKTVRSDITPDKLEELAREFDTERERQFLSPPPSEKRRHDSLVRQIKRRRGRPRIGKGAKRVQITVEGALLKSVDRFARARGISRSELISQGLRLAMAKKSA